MAFSVTNIGTWLTTGGSAGTQSATVPSGATIVVCWHDNGTAGSNASVSDAVSNTYTLLSSQTLNNLNAQGKGGVYYATNVSALSAQNITGTPTASSGCGFSAFYVTGAATSSIDSTVTASNSGSSTSPTVTAASIPGYPSSLIVGVAVFNGAPTFTQDSTNAAYASPPNNPGAGAATNRNLQGGNVVSSSKLTYNPAISPSSQWATFIFALKPSGAPLTGVAATSGFAAPTVWNPRGTYVVSGSRAGIGSAVALDSETTQTNMLSGIGAEYDPIPPSEINITLTGVSSSTAVGSLTPEVDQTLSGVSTSSAVGSLTPEVDKTLTGVVATFATGTLSIQADAGLSLTGQVATGSVGSPTIEIDESPALTGQVATGAVGSLAIEIDDSESLTGQVATGSVGTLSVQLDGSLTLTGQAATSSIGTLSAQSDRSITLTGQSATAGITALSVNNPRGTYVLAGSRAGIGSVVIIDSETTQTDMVVGVGAEFDAIPPNEIDLFLSGVSSTSAVGTLSTGISTSPAITGVASTTALGTLLVRLDSSVTLTGVAATSGVGAIAPTLLALPSLLVTVGLGILGVETQNATLVGVQSYAVVGQPLVTSGPNVTNIPLNGIVITSGIGSPTHTLGITPTGVSVAAQIGTIGEATHNGGLMLTDVECLVENVLPDDFEVTLRWSDTDGQSWSDSAIRSIGATGAYLTSPQWRRLGMARRQRVFELSWSCPKATALAGATVQFEDAAS